MHSASSPGKKVKTDNVIDEKEFGEFLTKKIDLCK